MLNCVDRVVERGRFVMRGVNERSWRHPFAIEPLRKLNDVVQVNSSTQLATFARSPLPSIDSTNLRGTLPSV